MVVDLVDCLAEMTVQKMVGSLVALKVALLVLLLAV